MWQLTRHKFGTVRLLDSLAGRIQHGLWRTINGLPLSANDVGFSPPRLSPAIMLLVL
jgi:hypothetical protein